MPLPAKSSIGAAARACTIMSTSRRSLLRPTDPASSWISASVTRIDCDGIEANPLIRALARFSTTE